ncbi:MAG: hypothetical protein ACD_3C00146G0006 [uncultured bacterium (gcode 4)]|uniref:Uncharacterized protein n=1 Tax=uncultured bacterium (gcode 4) TaxID=1234023 RepID=K2G0V1_9BACT|nr:MAG: hypothetical protein ACD_3C00146G0006 [uncultured bacterium (gcode 4)]
MRYEIYAEQEKFNNSNSQTYKLKPFSFEKGFSLAKGIVRIFEQLQ